MAFMDGDDDGPRPRTGGDTNDSGVGGGRGGLPPLPRSSSRENDNNNTDGGSTNIVFSSMHASGGGTCNFFSTLWYEFYTSSTLLFDNKLNWLLVLGPVALLGDATGFLGEAACFAFSGIALIPCAERLSFVTEQVAEHTNGTIGALLNATFGNAPELLIATAALRSGLYRVVQLAMLGSMLTNMLFVFGIACLVGGIRWQVQELRITSGNVSVGMLLLSTAGSLLPAAVILSGQLANDSTGSAHVTASTTARSPSIEELQFCRVNAFLMIFMYGCYLIFQLGTHKDEFDEEETVVHTANGNDLILAPHYTSRHGRQNQAKRNLFCLGILQRITRRRGMRRHNDGFEAAPGLLRDGDIEMSTSGRRIPTDHELLRQIPRDHRPYLNGDDEDNSSGISDGEDDDDDGSSSSEDCLLPQNEAILKQPYADGYFDDYKDGGLPLPVSSEHDSFSETSSTRQRRAGGGVTGGADISPLSSPRKTFGAGLGTHAEDDKLKKKKKKSKRRKNNRPHGILLPLGLADPSEMDDPQSVQSSPGHAQMSFRAGILWLFVITLGISAMSDILVDTIDGFADRLNISKVFTSMIIVPFFSNVAEQVSAVLFAYRNEMDLCVGVTVGSAIQVATFVLPGCVIIGWLVDKPMTLYFHAYETMCLFLAVIVIAATLQGGTTNWLVGATCVSIYVMIATGFWFHTDEILVSGT